MKHQAPTVNNSRRNSVTVDEVAGHLIKRGVSKIQNPLVQALVEEMEPEINGLLKKNFRHRQVDLEAVGNIASRVGSVMRRANQKMGRTS